MQNSAWIDLLRRLPPEQQDGMAFVTTVGIEINLQSILRIENDYAVIRGRLAGTTDTGRVFFVPYTQINYLGFNKEVKEPQIRALYGEGPPPEPVESKSEAVSTPAPEPQPTVEQMPALPLPLPQPEALPPIDPSKLAPQLKIPRKSGVLERLRARAQLGKSGTTPPSP